MSYNQEVGKGFIEQWFEKSVVPSLSEFIKIPNLSRHFDKEYKTNGLLEKAGMHIKSWIEGLGLKGLTTELMQPEDLTPLVWAQIQGEIKGHTILFYGHFDKQPHLSGWDANKGPITPVIENNRLYGRGSVDDGYSVYTYLLAIRALQQQGVPLPRIVLLMEGDQESGMHIETYLERLKERLGEIDMVFVLDSDIVDFQRCWLNKSIRGVLGFDLKVKILHDGVHSGDSSGIVPSTFKIVNLLLDRLQDLETGQINSFFQRNIPAVRYNEFYETAQEMGMGQFDHLKIVEGLRKMSDNPLELLINRGWKPTLTVTGLTGLPQCASAGNLMLPQLSLRVSMRLPPTFPQLQAQNFIRKLLTTNTPFECTVQISNFDIAQGWNCAPYDPWFEQAIQSSAQTVFETRAFSLAEGGAIPVVGCLAKAFPKASILVSGALGPNANAHGPNQFLDLPYTVKLTRFLASIVGKASSHYLEEAK